MTEHELTPELVAGMETPVDPRLSPDGRRVAFTVQAATKQKGRKHPDSSVWVASLPAGGAPGAARRWTRGRWRDQSPRWALDGQRLGFLSDREQEGELQVWQSGASGGEGRPITCWKGGVVDFAWSPDSTRVAFTAPDEAWADERKHREESGDDPMVWSERPGFRRLHVQSTAGGEVQTFSPAGRHILSFCWSPSGREISVALALRPELDAPASSGVDLVRLSLDGSAPQSVCHLAPGFAAGVKTLLWSRDEQQLLFINWERGIPSSLALWAVVATGGQPRCLTAAIDGCVIDCHRPESSDAVVCSVAEGLTTRLYEIDVESGRRTLLQPGVTQTMPGQFHVDAAGQTIAAICSGGTQPPDVWCGPIDGGLRRASNCNSGLRGLRWAEQEQFTWTAPDGRELDGLVLRPVGQRASSGPAPGVVLVHGGPYGRWADGFNCGNGNWAQWLALAGYTIFLPNPRGGMGHGHGFAATVAGEVGMADWLDVASGADAFVRESGADPERLGIGGWSQGGFMTAWAAGGGISPEITQRPWNEDYTHWQSDPGDRFRAGIAGAGPTDWGSMAATSDLPTFEAMLGGGRPGDGVGPHRHAVVSPVSYASRVRMPLLFLHGGSDERVPPGQAVGFFRELQSRGVPSELVLYPREPHGIAESMHVIDMQRRVGAWFDHWLRS